MASTDAKVSSFDPANVPWNNLIRFVRQLSHDLRNHLNAAELQAAYLGEIATDDEIKAEIKRLRQMMSEMGTVLQKLSASFSQPNPDLMPYPTADFVEDVRRKLATDYPKEAATVEWDIQVPPGNIEIDPQLVQAALLELFANAFRHQPTGQPLKVSAAVEGNSFVFRLREPKQDFTVSTENWGREPLGKITQGHYGLGLNRARVIVQAHGGQLAAEYDSKSATFSTTVTLPLSRKSA